MIHLRYLCIDTDSDRIILNLIEAVILITTSGPMQPFKSLAESRDGLRGQGISTRFYKLDDHDKPFSDSQGLREFSQEFLSFFCELFPLNHCRMLRTATITPASRQERLGFKGQVDTANGIVIKKPWIPGVDTHSGTMDGESLQPEQPEQGAVGDETWSNSRGNWIGKLRGTLPQASCYLVSLLIFHGSFLMVTR